MPYDGLQTETVALRGHNGDQTEGYLARPARAGKVPCVVVIHHMPGWDEWTTEVVRKFAHHGYAAIAPNLFVRYGPGSPDDVTARARAAAEVAAGCATARAFGAEGASIAMTSERPTKPMATAATP